MLADNRHAISLMKRMGFALTYSGDGTVEGTLDLGGETATVPVPPKDHLGTPSEAVGARPPSTIRSIDKTPPAIAAVPSSNPPPPPG
jgi:hypothetical protein